MLDALLGGHAVTPLHVLSCWAMLAAVSIDAMVFWILERRAIVRVHRAYPTLIGERGGPRYEFVGFVETKPQSWWQRFCGPAFEITDVIEAVADGKAEQPLLPVAYYKVRGDRGVEQVAMQVRLDARGEFMYALRLREREMSRFVLSIRRRSRASSLGVRARRRAPRRHRRARRSSASKGSDGPPGPSRLHRLVLLLAVVVYGAGCDVRGDLIRSRYLPTTTVGPRAARLMDQLHPAHADRQRALRMKEDADEGLEVAEIDVQQSQCAISHAGDVADVRLLQLKLERKERLLHANRRAIQARDVLIRANKTLTFVAKAWTRLRENSIPARMAKSYLLTVRAIRRRPGGARARRAHRRSTTKNAGSGGTSDGSSDPPSIDRRAASASRGSIHFVARTYARRLPSTSRRP